MPYSAHSIQLGDLIEWLEQQPQEVVVCDGFGHPHSYRGYYEDLAFEPKAKTKIGDMLKAAKTALGRTFHGWKGGEFTMGADTDIWIAHQGCTGEPITSAHFRLWERDIEACWLEEEGE